MLELPELWAGKRKLVIVFASLFVVSVLVTLLVLSRGQRAAEAGGVSASTAAARLTESVPDSGVVREFILPPLRRRGTEGPSLLRPRTARWSEEQIQRYWIPLDGIALKLISEENDRRIEKLFAEVP